MRKVIEDTLVSLDGVYAGMGISKFSEYRADPEYQQDGLELALACGALVMGLTTYQDISIIWQRLTGPWSDRVNAMPKYVFSSTLEKADWNNTTILRGDVITEITRLKQQEGGDLLLYGHGLLAETLLKHHLLDMLNLSVFPLILGQGKLLYRQDETATLKLVATKSFPRGVVKLTYESQD